MYLFRGWESHAPDVLAARRETAFNDGLTADNVGIRGDCWRPKPEMRVAHEAARRDRNAIGHSLNPGHHWDGSLQTCVADSSGESKGGSDDQGGEHGWQSWWELPSW